MEERAFLRRVQVCIRQNRLAAAIGVVPYRGGTQMAIRLIGDPALTCHLQPLSYRRAVGNLSLFYHWLLKRSALLHTNLLEELRLDAGDWHNYLRLDEDTN
nr:unnamed protein product [Callosobruchus chinensis]